MRMKTLALLCAVLFPFAAPARAADPVPAASYFENSQFSDARLSPSGKYLAARVASKGERRRLAVMELDTLAIKVVAQFDDADVDYFEWVNDKRLVFNTFDGRETRADDMYYPGLFAINRDGSSFLQLADTRDSVDGFQRTSRQRLDGNHFLLRQPGRQHSDEVYVVSAVWDAGYRNLQHLALKRVDTVTGRVTGIKGPASVQSWWLDQDGEPRLALGADKNRAILYYRDKASDEWRTLHSFGLYSAEGVIAPEGFAPDGTLYVRAAPVDKEGLYRYDIAQCQLANVPLLALDGYDFRGDLVISRGRLAGISYLSDARGTAWFDEQLKAAQAAVDKLLPGRINELTPARYPQTAWVLVHSYADVDPGRWLIYNMETQKLVQVGSARPAIDPSRMASKTFVRYKARDGLEIPAWITYPKGSQRKNLPLVVLLHGGPWLRGGEWKWNADAQFLASRGYAVLEPEFRGSTGFGTRHFRAGWKQWGLAMQDDVSDGTRWAIAQGIADPKRICIAGASYGGYATLMGLAREPALYRCGVEWVGVTDIGLMANGHWTYNDDLGDRWRQYGIPELVGDVQRDAVQLRDSSPIHLANRIRQPLLMAYGTEDQRVPLYHGKLFLDAVRKHNNHVEWITYDREGHGWALPENRIDFWIRVERFLERNIGTGAKTE
jgi:dipeptidyl aminopeptidase/acylaminoacyl peptidase